MCMYILYIHIFLHALQGQCYDALSELTFISLACDKQLKQELELLLYVSNAKT